MTTFEHLLQPGRIGTMTLRNRLVMSPMETMYGTPEGLPSERTIAYFAARAAGGVGLVTVGATGIDHRHPETPGGLHLGTDEAVAAHRELVSAVHEHGAKIQPQIVHAGPDGLGPEMHGVTSLGPSVIPSYLTGRPSTEVTTEQIAEIFDLYRPAVRRAREAGYDGIELHAAHGYMFLGSFLAPQRNRRTDRYGGSVEGRIQVVVDALRAIRSEVGPDFPITLRISGYERVAGGRPMYETARVAPLLVEAGVDAFHVSGGVIDRLVTQMVNGADHGDGLNVGAAAAVKEVVDVPVIAVGRLHDPTRAEAVLADGRADFVALGRPLLADPDLPRKLAAGEADRVRRCISCENCIDSLEQRFSTDCAVNPFTGKEAELLLRPSKRRHLVVVGGGPGGLEAARLAAGQGHRVTLLEREEQLGGGMLLGSLVHPENAPFLSWLCAEIETADIDVRLGQVASVDDVVALEPDAVVVATGGRVVLPDLPGADLPHVYAGRALLGSDLTLGRRVAVVGGDLVAVEIAEHLAAGGQLVALLHDGDDVATEVGPKRRTEQLDRLDRLGVTVHVAATVGQITSAAIVFTPDGAGPRELAADAVVLVGVIEPDLELRDALAVRLPDAEIQAVGDCTGLGLIQGATEDAARAIHALARGDLVAR